MPDSTITDDEQTAFAASKVDGVDDAPADAANADGYSDLIGGKFKSQAEVLKAYENTQAEATRMAQELAELKRTVGQADSRKELVDALKEVVAGKGESAEDFAARKKAWIEELEGDHGAEATIDLFLQHQRDGDAKLTKSEQATQARIEALEKKLVESEARSDPAYINNREKIDAFAKKHGVGRAAAIEFYKDLVPGASDPVVPDGMEHSASLTVSGRRDGKKVDPRAGWTDQERQWDQEWGAAAMAKERTARERARAGGVR